MHDHLMQRGPLYLCYASGQRMHEIEPSINFSILLFKERRGVDLGSNPVHYKCCLAKLLKKKKKTYPKCQVPNYIVSWSSFSYKNCGNYS